MKLRKFLKQPWQIPIMVLVTIYGIYRYGFLDWRVIALFLIVVLFIIVEIKNRKNL